MIATEIISIGVAIASLSYSVIQTKLAKQQLAKSNELFSEEDELLESSTDVTEKISKIIHAEYKQINKITIINFGLDLETVMPWFKNKIGVTERYLNCSIDYRGLIVNDQSELLKPMINGASNIKSSYISASIESAQSFEALPVKNIKLEIRAYNTPPIFHGFIINEKHLFISFTEIQNQKLFGGVFPYMYFEYDRTSTLNAHYFRMFNSWFEETWEKSDLKVKVTK